VKTLILVLSAVVVLTLPRATLAQECADLADAFVRDADSMTNKALAALRGCVDRKLRERFGDAGPRAVPAPAPVPSPVPPPRRPPSSTMEKPAVVPAPGR
jgi:hypothetical protein